MLGYGHKTLIDSGAIKFERTCKSGERVSEEQGYFGRCGGVAEDAKR